MAAAAGDDPRAIAYVPRGRGDIIVCASTVVQKGLYFEQADSVSLPPESGPEALGETVWGALLLFRRDPTLDLRSRKKSGWPAHRAAGMKSMRGFESEFVRVSVHAFPSVLRVEAAVPAASANGLFVGRYITASCEFQDLGDLIRLACRCCVRIGREEFA
jgi:hypothetical protein